jgi:nucleotide-binding universal stress UspA family protein
MPEAVNVDTVLVPTDRRAAASEAVYYASPIAARYVAVVHATSVLDEGTP